MSGIREQELASYGWSYSRNMTGLGGTFFSIFSGFVTILPYQYLTAKRQISLVKITPFIRQGNSKSRSNLFLDLFELVVSSRIPEQGELIAGGISSPVGVTRRR